MTVQKLAGDASTREYFRLADPDSPKKSYILQCADPFLELATPKLEHPFLAARELLQVAGVPVPAIIDCNPAKGWILQQDLGDETLQTSGRIDLFQIAVDYSVRMVTEIRPDNPKLAKLTTTAPHFKWAFDFEKLNWEMNFTAEHLVTKLMKRDGEEFLNATTANTRYLDERPRFFAHRDYHSRNLMLQDNILYAIDFQDGRMGPITYDCVSLIWDPYVTLPDDVRQKLWASFVKGVGRDDLEEETCRMIIQRMLKAAGSYASFYNNRGRTSYLPSIAPAITNVHWALKRLEQINCFTQADAQLLTQVSAISANLDAILTIQT